MIRCITCLGTQGRRALEALGSWTRRSGLAGSGVGNAGYLGRARLTITSHPFPLPDFPRGRSDFLHFVNHMYQSHFGTGWPCLAALVALYFLYVTDTRTLPQSPPVNWSDHVWSPTFRRTQKYSYERKNHNFCLWQICLKFYVYDGVTREGRVAHATFYPSASQTTLAFKFTFNSCKLPSL